MKRHFAIAALWLVLLPAASVSAFAQNSDVREMLARLERVQRELTTLQQYVYKGRPPPAPAAASAASANGLDQQTAARFEVRLTQLETEIRAITGRIEEVQHDVRQVGSRLDKLVSDVDFRLAAIEKNQAALKAQAEEGETKTPAQGEQMAAAASPQSDAKVDDNPKAVPPHSLGKVSKSAVAGQQTAKAAAPVAGKAQYDQAIDLMQAQKFSEAETAFKEFIASNPKHGLLANAHYWLGETYYVRKDYQRAAYTFAEGFQKFPESGKAPDNLLKLGMSLGRLGKKKEACTAFTRLLENFPKSSKTLKGRVSREQRTYGCG